MTNLGKRDWNKIVSESNGKLILLPDSFKGAAEDWMKSRNEYNDHIKIMAKKELILNMALNNLLFELRKYLEKNGREDIYLKDIGFEETALEEGKFIINLLDPNKSQLPIR